MQTIKPPQQVSIPKDSPVVFLAGSIEQGKAEDWQDKLTDRLNNLSGYILNPRRDIWDNTWEQSIDNPIFEEQVVWELDGLDQSDIIALYFDPKTNAPISLLELGLHAKSGKIIVCCPKEFYRIGNVEIVCKEYDIPLYENFEMFADKIILEVQEFMS